MQITLTRIRRWFWLMNPVRVFQGWCAFTTRDCDGKIQMIGAINVLKSKEFDLVLKVFWENTKEV